MIDPGKILDFPANGRRILLAPSNLALNGGVLATSSLASTVAGIQVALNGGGAALIPAPSLAFNGSAVTTSWMPNL